MGIVIQNGGPLTTVQDLGRIGYQDLGFSVSGAMDQRAFRLANLLLDNQPGDAMLEVTLMGPQLTFQQDNCFVLTGAPMGATLGEIPLDTNRVYTAKAGDVLTFPKRFPTAGSRSYIAFAGGLDVPPLMGSRSTYMKGRMGGVEGRALKTGDTIPFLAPKAALPNLEKRVVTEEFSAVYGGKEVPIRVILGPQDSAFTPQGLSDFLSQPYSVTPNSDRMGSRLEGTQIGHVKGADIVSDGIAFGAIQVPSNGQPIILLADRQSTGGYTKIATVITTDLPKVTQRQIGDKIYFSAVTVEEAQSLLIQEQEQMQLLAKGWQEKEGKPSFWQKIFGKK